jgi:undecaprenyl-diphosphatase
MVKTILKIILAVAVVYVSIEMFRYFSYWGLGINILILLVALVVILWEIILSFILQYKAKIITLARAIIERIKSNKKWQAFNHKVQIKWPRLYRFFFNRTRVDRPTGWYLSLGIIISSVFFFFFLGIIQDIWFKDPLYFADLRIISLLHAITSEKLNYFFVFFTNLANWQTIIIGLTLAVAYLFLTKNKKVAKYLIATAAGGFLLSYIAKIIFHRPRPIATNLIASPASYSLPSGHALISVCFYGFIAYLLFKKLKNKFSKLAILILFLLLAILIGLSRTYLGVHYPSDVLAGWYLGFAILALGVTFAEIENKFYAKKPVPSPEKKLLLSAYAVLFLIFSVVSFGKIKIIQPANAFTETNLASFSKTTSLYSEDLFGQKMEPISFIVIGERQQIINLFTTAGWSEAEKPNFKNFLKLSSAIAKNTSYPAAPMTPSFYQSKANDLGFEKSTELNTARQRHHTRYWKTNYKINNAGVWVATASFDQGVELGPIIQLPVHKINPDIDAEREFIMNDLEKTGLIGSYQKIDLVGEIKGTNAAGDSFTTDGRAYLIYF